MTGVRYQALFYSYFDSQFKKCLKKHKHTFQDDFDNLKLVIIGRLLINDDPKKLPGNPHVIPLGSEIKFPIIKIEMHLKK